MDSDEEESDEETKTVKLPLSVYIAEGRLQFVKGNYEKAAGCYTEVIERKPDSAKCLVARSQCYFHLNDYKNALKDAEDAIKIDRKLVQAIFQKAETEYVMGNFEFALVTFQRGYMRRPDYQGFRLGVQKCQQAILNSIGKSANITLTEQDCVVKEELLKKKKKQKKAETDEVEAKKTKPRRSKVDLNARTLLREVAVDKEYLEELLESGVLKQYVKPESRKALYHTREGLKFLQNCQDFWQQERPLYARKKVRCALRGTLVHKPAQVVCTVVQQGFPLARQASRHLEAAQRSMHRKDYDLSMRECMLALEIMDTLSEDVLYNKPTLVADALNIMGEANLEMNNLEAAVELFEKEIVVSVKNVLPDIHFRALQNLGRCHVRLKNYEQAYTVFEQTLPLCASEIQSAYALHEMGRCKLSVCDLQSAREVGKTALVQAQISESIPWKLNTNVLLAEIEERAQDLKKAALYVEAAIQEAHRKGNLKAKAALYQDLDRIQTKLQEMELQQEEVEDGRNESGSMETEETESESVEVEKESDS